MTSYLTFVLSLATGCTSEAQQPSFASEREELQFRTWTDISGRYQTEAAMTRFADGKVHLKKKDGRGISIPIEGLSKADQEYVRREVARKASQEQGGRRELDSKAVQAADWPQFRGPGGLGLSDARGLPVTWSGEQNIAWKTELPGPGSSSPIVVGDRVFVTCYSGYGIPGQDGGEVERLKRHLVCLNLGDGKILWDKAVAAKTPEEPYQSWMTRHGYASSTPASDGDRVYTFFGKSGVFAFDHAGRQLWQADVGSSTYGYGSATSPVLYGELLIVNACAESNSLVALDKETGREVWRFQKMEESYNTPLLVELPGGRTELVVETYNQWLGLDPATGEKLWSCATGYRDYVCPSLVAHDGTVYGLGGRSGKGMAARAGGRGDVSQSHLVWKGTKGSPNVPSPVYHGGHLYYSNEDGIAHCVDAKTGSIVYQQRLNDRSGQIWASPVVADGKLYYVSKAGRTFVLAAEPTFEQLATNDLGDGSIFNASPAATDGRLLLRSDRFLYCIGTRH